MAIEKQLGKKKIIKFLKRIKISTDNKLIKYLIFAFQFQKSGFENI